MELLLILAAIAAFIVFKSYNKLRSLSEGVKRGRADIAATLKKRQDIAQRLSDIAKSYGEHEKLSHFTVVEGNTNIADARAAEASTNRVISQMQTLANAFPDLKANQTFQQLMSQLEGLETDILNRRERYNAEAQVYNSYRSALPQVLFASSIGFEEAPYYTDADDGVDALASFKTDDGTMLKEQMGRLASRATTKATEIRDQVTSHVTKTPAITDQSPAATEKSPAE